MEVVKRRASGVTFIGECCNLLIRVIEGHRGGGEGNLLPDDGAGIRSVVGGGVKLVGSRCRRYPISHLCKDAYRGHGVGETSCIVVFNVM